MKKKEEQPGEFIPVFGMVYNLDKPEELQKAYEVAVNQKKFANSALQQARRYYDRCNRLVMSLQIEISNRRVPEAVEGKEAKHV